MAPPRRFLAWIAALALMAHSSPADAGCCGCPDLIPLRAEVANSQLVLFGKLANYREDCDGRGTIDLLVTDVGLPGGMNGRQVADTARQEHPELKVLFITGFAESAVVSNGNLPSGMAVITKPFALTALSQKIRDLIDQ